MLIHRDVDAIPAAARGCVVALGNFDGVHRGHQRILARAREIARRQGKPFGVLTFEPHPRRFFRPEAPALRLLPFHHKARLLRQLGVEHLFVLRFNAALASLTAPQFVEETLIARLGVDHVVIGHDFVFGKGRSGNAALLQEYATKGALGLQRINPVGQGEHIYSSSLIRTFVEHGHMAEAAAMLGTAYTLMGRVIHGDARGREFGYPTANLRLPPILKPAYGVYAARLARFPHGPMLPAVASFGVRPTVTVQGAPLLEVHVFGHRLDLYGERVAVELIGYLRPEQRFDTLEAMIAQMDDDSAAARRVLERLA